MVGCKTIVRERWGQWLKEADRIEEKYALCVDSTLSDDLIQRLSSKLRFFLPLSVLESAYAGRASRPFLGTVADLVASLTAVL
jgi:hypothetical protein